MLCNLRDRFAKRKSFLFTNGRLGLVIWLIGSSLLIPGCQLFSDPDRIYNQVEIMPEPPEGFQSFQSYVTHNLIYPEEALKQRISGTVLVQFVVTEDGAITKVEIIEGLGFGCDQESIRVIRASGLWKPGRKDGEPVKVRLVLPIDFVADSNS